MAYALPPSDDEDEGMDRMNVLDHYLHDSSDDEAVAEANWLFNDNGRRRNTSSNFAELFQDICTATGIQPNTSDRGITRVDGKIVTKIFVIGLDEEATEDEVLQIFTKYGDIKEIKIIGGKLKNKFSRSAFVTYKDAFSATRALKERYHHRRQIRHNVLKVLVAHSWHQPDDGKQWTQDTSTMEGECLIDKLNDDCLLHIFQKLTIKDQMKVERVCKRWKDLSQSLWLRRNTIHLKSLTNNTGIFSVPAFKKIINITGENITELDFSNLRSDNLSAVFPVIVFNCPNLEILKIKEMSISSYNIITLGYKCKQLRYLKMENCTGLTDKNVFKMLSTMNNLECLNISRNLSIHGGVFARTENFSIKALILNGCNNFIMKNLIRYLEKNNCKIETLHLDSCQSLTATDFAQIINARKTQLKDLSLTGILPRLKPEDIKCIGRLTELTKLNLKLSFCVESINILEVATKCINLKELDISGFGSLERVTDVHNRCIDAVSYINTIEILKINYIRITDVGLDSIAKRCRNLKHLECMGCPNITNTGIINILTNCQRLEHFDISGCRTISSNVLREALLSLIARKDKIKLTFCVQGTNISDSDIKSINSRDPLLLIVTSDINGYKERFRPDYHDEIYNFDDVLSDDDSDPDVDYTDSDDSDYIDEEHPLDMAALNFILHGGGDYLPDYFFD